MGFGQLISLTAAASLSLSLLRSRRQALPAREVVEAWDVFARQQGLLTRTDGDARTAYEGVVNGRWTRIRRTQAADRQSRGLAEVCMYLPHVPPAMTVEAGGAADETVADCGATLETGDGGFDAAFRIRCPDPGPALSYLTADRRRILGSLARRVERLRLDRDGLSVCRSADLSSKAELANLFNHLEAAAERLTRA